MAKILIVEDERYLNQNICELLEMKGYSTRSAYDGKHALSEILNFRPDLVISDIMMPEMNGLEFVKALREIKEFALTPCIFLSAKQEKENIREGMTVGADDYLTKPFDKNELFNSVESCLKKSNLRKEAMVKEVEKVMSLVASRSAHEFNTPLNGIITGASLLLDHGNNLSEENVQKILKGILSSGMRLKTTTNNLLLHIELIEFSEKVKNSVKENIVVISNEEIQNYIDHAFIEKFRSEDMEISIENATIVFSNYYLERIIIELLNNAFKFSQEGQKVQISGKVEGSFYKIQIKDFGVGMDNSQIASIEAFRQFDRQKKEQQGSGLGLYIVRSLMNLSELPMEIQSIPEKYTEIIIKFKLK